MWTLSGNRKTVRLKLPPLPVAGLPELFRVSMDLDAGTVDAIIDSLAPAHPGRRSPGKE
jgi:hypothetical protein